MPRVICLPHHPLSRHHLIALIHVFVTNDDSMNENQNVCILHNLYKKMFWAWIRRSPISFFTISLKIYKDNILNFSNYLLRHQSLLYYHFCMCIEFFYTISSNLMENITYSTTLLTKVISSIQLWNVAMLNILKRSIAIHCFSSSPILMNELVAILFLIRSFMGGAGLCFFHAS